MNIEIPDEDAATIRAILLTHAEMQDQAMVKNEQERGRLMKRGGEDERIDDLKEDHEDLIEDRDNLKRIADIFQ